MKSKKFYGKLVLNKETVTNLTNNQMKTANGGTGIIPPTNESACITEWCDWITIIDCPSQNCQ